LWSAKVATLSYSIDSALQNACSSDGIAGLVEQLFDESSARLALVRARNAGYLSPEQVRGERCDNRSDVFVLGCLLYEKLSGTPPFTGGTKAERKAAILAHDPPDLADPPYRMRSGLARVIARCLEKHPDRRFQSTHELASALRTVEAEPLRRGARMAAVVAGALLIAALVLLTSRVDRGRWPWTTAPVHGAAMMPLVNR
jgi:hypothetical protein